jgi:hypothetical protein
MCCISVRTYNDEGSKLHHQLALGSQRCTQRPIVHGLQRRIFFLGTTSVHLKSGNSVDYFRVSDITNKAVSVFTALVRDQEVGVTCRNQTASR